MPLNTENNKFLNVLSVMVGTYTRTAGDAFAFIHDLMIKNVGCQFPGLILQYMSSDYHTNYIKVDTDNTSEIRIRNASRCGKRRVLQCIYD